MSEDKIKLYRTTATYLQHFIEVVCGPEREVSDIIVSDQYYKGRSYDDKEPVNIIMSDNDVLRMKPGTEALGAILWYYGIHNSRFTSCINSDFAKYLRENVRPVLKPSEHSRISCSKCNMRPILGARYKCEMCPGEYSLCDKCATATFHEHALVKIHSPYLVLSRDSEGRNYFDLK